MLLCLQVSAPTLPVKTGGNKDNKPKGIEKCLKMGTAGFEGTVLSTGKILSRHGATKLPSFKVHGLAHHIGSNVLYLKGEFIQK